jgi:mono/diheme cytochrome c family protein
MMKTRSLLTLIAFVSFFNAVAQDSQGVEVPVDPGKMVYEQNCLACHQVDGSGVPFLAPPLIEGTFVNGDKKRLIEILLKGLQGVEIKGEQYANPMPAFDYLSDKEIADLLTYVRGNFKNNGDAVTEAEVKSVRDTK